MPCTRFQRSLTCTGIALAATLLTAGCSLLGSSSTSGPASATDAAGRSAAAAASAGASLRPSPTPSDPGTRAVLTAIDQMDGHGPYVITLTTGSSTAFLEVIPPGKTHYYTTKDRTVGEEISVDGAVWVRGPDGHWQTTDGVTHHGPALTVGSLSSVTELAQGTDGGRQYRSYRVAGKDADGSYQGTVTVWVDGGLLRDVRLTRTDKVTTAYTYRYQAQLTITPPTG